MREDTGYNYTYDFTLRVAKGMYSRRDYNKVRLSVITQSSKKPSGLDWDYSAQFTYMWTDNYIHTALVDVDAGGSTEYNIDGNKFSIKLPEDGKASRGIVFADPCFTQDGSWCVYGGRFYTFNRMTDLLNAASDNDDIDWWYIGGDNFYDNTDYWTKNFFGALNTNAKSKMTGMTLGNHDYWHDGSNGNGKTSDQLGIGMTQYWAPDVMSSTMMDNGEPYDWSISPWNKFWDSPPPVVAENSIWWTKIGNLAFIGWSGAYDWDTYAQYFDQACQEFSNDESISMLFLISHWDGVNLSCKWGMSAPDVLNKLRSDVGSCSSFKYRMKYIDGHDHRNTMYQTGFKIGGMGMSGGGQTGVLYAKTDDAGEAWVYYIEFQNDWGGNYYDAFLSCVKKSGMDSCLNRDGVTLWYNQPPLTQQCWDKMSEDCTYKGDTSTCGDRIEWLEANQGMDFKAAYDQVVSDCGRQCECVFAPTPKPTTGPPTPKPDYPPCSEMLDYIACDHDGCHSCGDRINWLENNGYDKAGAYEEVAEEFPTICVCDNPPKVVVEPKATLI